MRRIFVVALLAGTVAALGPGMGTYRGLEAQERVDHSVGIRNRHIYPDVAAAHTDVAEAIKTARREHKRVLLDFGGDWCPDCQVLDIYLHDDQNKPLLEQSFVLAHVNIGRQDENLDIPKKYGIDVTVGVPALAVIEPSGKIIFAQTRSDFRSARLIESKEVTAFLQKYKS